MVVAGTLYRSAGAGPAAAGRPVRRGSTTALTVAVVLGALAVTVLAVRDLPSQLRAGGLAIWLIIGLAVLVDVRPFAGRTRGATVLASLTFTFALLLGWGLAVAVAAQVLAGIAAAIRVRAPAWPTAYDVARSVLAFAAAAVVIAAAGVPWLTDDDVANRPRWEHLLAILLAGVVWYAVNAVLATFPAAVAQDRGWLQTLQDGLRRNSRAVAGLLALAPLVIISGNVNPLFIPLVLVPLLIVGQLTRDRIEEARKASTDELTGLPNRKALYSQMRAHARAYGERLRRSRNGADSRRMALLLLDIDQFRQVNGALGHVVGDRLLIAVADRLRSAIGPDGLVCRLGGDEFSVLAPRLADEEAAAVLARRAADAFIEPVALDGLPLDVTAAIGVAIYPDHGTDVITLLRHAETAMYDAKERSATYALYTPEAEQHSPERLELLADLRRALDSGSDELQLHFQPQVDLATGHVSGAESLLRWSHPERGFVSPDTVIKIAEHTALMRRITARVLQDAVSQLAAWRAAGLDLRLSVNVSARDLHRGEFVEELAGLLAERGVPPNQLQLEITEGALLADQRRAMLTLHRLDKLGIALSLDDFGTGYSSMQHLRRMPLAEVKIDKSFVLGMTSNPDDEAIVGTVIDLGGRLGLRVVAEGVEDDETRRLLLELGCEVGQGWYFARPMPAEAFVAWLGRR
jgi:diguanylate cyclase (GGDEF)-like protein